MDKSEHLKDMDKFLHGRLSGKALADFELRLKNDKTFKADFDLFDEVHELLEEDMDEMDFRANLNKLSNRQKTPALRNYHKYKYAIWLLPVLLVGLWYVYNSKTEVINPNSKTALSTIVEEDESDEFAQNPSLEYLIKNIPSVKNMSLKITKAQSDIELKDKKESVNFHISGILKSDKELFKTNFKVYVYSNKKSDYKNFLPLLVDEIDLNKKSDAYHFDFQKTISPKSGLLYYLIENSDTEELLFINKFQIN